ncbi:hypothetical protein RRG08_055990 [Elysia crispata]|uniref:Uncharacterized protein n=1 Tax=Elysia crispata TaxID=231223 RepID=A0AAE1AG58_9GAST|nr:hypothetical protein RRG08_055990 [Elysia crispata]
MAKPDIGARVATLVNRAVFEELYAINSEANVNIRYNILHKYRYIKCSVTQTAMSQINFVNCACDQVVRRFPPRLTQSHETCTMHVDGD